MTIALGVRIFGADATAVAALVRVESYDPAESVGEDVFFQSCGPDAGKAIRNAALETVRVG